MFQTSQVVILVVSSVFLFAYMMTTEIVKSISHARRIHAAKKVTRARRLSEVAATIASPTTAAAPRRLSLTVDAVPEAPNEEVKGAVADTAAAGAELTQLAIRAATSRSASFTWSANPINKPGKIAATPSAIRRSRGPPPPPPRSPGSASPQVDLPEE